MDLVRVSNFKLGLELLDDAPVECVSRLGNGFLNEAWQLLDFNVLDHPDCIVSLMMALLYLQQVLYQTCLNAVLIHNMLCQREIEWRFVLQRSFQ